MRGSTPNACTASATWIGDVGQRLGVGIDVDRRVGEELHVVLEQHHVHAGRAPHVGAHAQDLQRRPDGVGVGRGQAGHQAVGVAGRTIIMPK